ncbi:MAG: hypothetical protein HOP29_15705 [Phycisphaerales bacterium]|nr:hypothetical protein [Phycisphaerales bacterium]
MKRARATRKGITRRHVLKGTVAGGTAFSVLPLLPGCPDFLQDILEQQPREWRTLHFDFSHVSDEHRNERLVVHVPGSSSHLSVLRPHDGASRRRFRGVNAALGDITDESLTHYAEGISLPADALQLYWVTLGERKTGNPRLVGAFLHLPRDTTEVIDKRAR